MEKYDNYTSKNRLIYDYNNIHCNPSYLNRNISNSYKYNSYCDNDYLLNRYCCEPVPCYELYKREPMYLNQIYKNNCDYNFNKVYPDNLLHNTKFENYHVPNSQSNYNSQIPKYNSNLKYQRYFKSNDFIHNKKENKENNNLENSEANKLENENNNNNININQKSDIEPNNVNNNINQENEKSDIKENNINNSQNINKKNYYHFNASMNNNYINNNINRSYKPNEPDNNNTKKEIIINNSPCDFYYNTLHEEYLPKKDEEIPLKNNNSRRTYEIDSSRWKDNNNNLFSHSNILNDLMRKNYCCEYNYYC